MTAIAHELAAEHERYRVDDDTRLHPPTTTGAPRVRNLVDVAGNTKTGGPEILLYDDRGEVHRCTLTPAATAALIRRLAGYLAAFHERSERGL